MYWFIVTLRTTGLKITPQAQFCPRSSTMMSNQPNEVVQGHQGGPHVPVLCDLKDFRPENHNTGIVQP